MVRLAESFVARLVAGDEPVGVDHGGEPIDRLGLGVPSPGQGVDRPAPLHGFRGPGVGLEHAEVERVEVEARRGSCGREDPVRRADGQRQGGEEVAIGLVDRLGRRAVGRRRSPGGTGR